MSALVLRPLPPAPWMQDIPHVSQCSLCFHCDIGGEPPHGAESLQGEGIKTANSISYSSLDPPNKQSLPKCERCYGCNTMLSRIGSASTHFKYELAQNWL